MKKLDELLDKKLIEIEIKEKQFYKEKENELSRKEQELLQQKKLRKKKKIKLVSSCVMIYGLGGCVIGAFLGLFLGFGKGCIEYGQQRYSLLQPFWYIPEYLFYSCIIGLIIGVLVGLIIGQLQEIEL